jgi:hypothetical protein
MAGKPFSWSVQVKPGQKVFTVIPGLPHLFASVRSNPVGAVRKELEDSAGKTCKAKSTVVLNNWSVQILQSASASAQTR